MNKKGFTLIELIAVITILGIIALISTASVLGIFNKSQTSLYDTQVEIIEDAANKWVIANSGYLPLDGSTYSLALSRLVSDGYLDDGDVLDPRTKTPIDGYIEVVFDTGVNQYKCKLINREENVLTKESILAVNTPVESGEGLYIDESESGRYYFKGKNVNNYINFNNETWRIISIEPNGQIKIIKQTGSVTKAFDSIGARNASNGNPGCTHPNGCPIWGNNKDTDNTIIKDSELFTYLNSEYYESLNQNEREVLTSGKWCYRFLSTNDTEASEFIEDQFVNFCAEYEITDGTLNQVVNETNSSNVGLISVKEIRDASLNTCSYGEGGTTCDSYLNNGENYWTLNYSARSLIMTASGYINSKDPSDTSIKVRPVLYINSSTNLTGRGTASNPFKIKQTH